MKERVNSKLFLVIKVNGEGSNMKHLIAFDKLPEQWLSLQYETFEILRDSIKIQPLFKQ